MIRTSSTWCLFIYYLTKLIKLINKNLIYLQKFIFSNFFISKGAINFFRVNLTFTKYITTNISIYHYTKVSIGSLYFDKKLFISKFFRVKSCGVESSDAESTEAESFKVESLLPMPLSIFYTKSLTF